jgi:hypothetical protein
MNEKLFIILCFLTLGLTFTSCNSDDEDNDSQSNNTGLAVTGQAKEVGMTLAVIEGYMNYDCIPSGTSHYIVGIELSTENNFSNKPTQFYKGKMIEGNKFNVILRNLNCSTTYYYRTRVEVDDVNYLGETRSFTTKDITATLTTNEAEDITYTSVNINIDVHSDFRISLNDVIVGVAYSEDKSRITQDDIANDEDLYSYWGYIETDLITCACERVEDNTFKADIHSLKPGKTYYYCAYLKVGDKIVMGEVKSFNTLQFNSQLLKTNDISDVEQTTATASGTTSLAKNIASVYPAGTSVVYGISYIAKNDYPYDYFFEHGLLGNTDTYTSFDGETFTRKLVNLTPGTTYYYRAFAFIGYKDYLTGEVKSFTTPEK